MRGLTPGLTDQSLASAGVEVTADQIQETLIAELVLQGLGGTLTADGMEQTLYIASEPLGLWHPLNLVIDLDAMQGGDTIVVKVYHRINDAGFLKLLAYYTWTGADGGLSNGEVMDSIEFVPNRHGWQLTLQQTAGTNRAYPWELFMEA